MRLALPLDSRSLSATSTDLCVSTRCCVLYHWRLTCVLATLLWPPDIQVKNLALPRRSLVRRFALCAALPCARWSCGNQNKHAAPVQPQSPPAQVADVACCCSALFVSPVDNSCHLRMWSIHVDPLRLSKKYQKPWCQPLGTTAVGGCDYGRLQITREALWKHTSKRVAPQAWSTQI